MRSDHLMLWMSSVKPVTAIAIAQMWERGLLSIDDPVARHIPEFAVNGKAAITIRHVLTHTGGFPKAALQWSDAPWDNVVAEICAGPIEAGWIPGQTAGYHVACGWYILGELVRRLDGRPYSRYVRESIFEPLGMIDSLARNARRAAPQIRRSHRRDAFLRLDERMSAAIQADVESALSILVGLTGSVRDLSPGR